MTNEAAAKPPSTLQSEAADLLIDVERFVQRFDRSQPSVLAVRTYETAFGERYSLVSCEEWAGL